MTRTTNMFLPVLLLYVVAAGAAVAAPPELPATPLAAGDLLYARQFTLAEGFTFRYSAEKPVVNSGWILILETDPAIAYPRQSAMPMLYVGEKTASYAPKGYPSGTVIAMVPGDVDLFNAPIWFGTPELPERVDAEIVSREARLARANGITPFPEHVVGRALEAGGPPLVLLNITALEQTASALAREYITNE